VTGFAVGTDSVAQGGILEFQAPQPPPPPLPPPPALGNRSVAGDYLFGTQEPLDATTLNALGTLTSNTVNLTNVVADWSFGNKTYCLQSNCPLLLGDEPLSGPTFTVNKDGTATLGAQSVAVTNGHVIFYIDESPLNPHPAVGVVEQ
jgi:hypothetical protein